MGWGGDAVTEAEWMECADPRPMLEFLRGKAGDRKLRLFVCAFCRSLDNVFADADCYHAVKVAERFADGLASREELREVCEAARLVWAASNWAGMLAAETTETDDVPRRLWKSQSDFLRDLFGNPFRPAALDPAWLSWNNGTVPKLAQAAYDDRLLPSGELDPARLAVLADALEESGCADAGLLGHLRGPLPHVCGCFAVDLLTGRE
jgi:hypothetical protein